MDSEIDSEIKWIQKQVIVTPRCIKREKIPFYYCFQTKVI